MPTCTFPCHRKEVVIIFSNFSGLGTELNQIICSTLRCAHTDIEAAWKLCFHEVKLHEDMLMFTLKELPLSQKCSVFVSLMSYSLQLDLWFRCDGWKTTQINSVGSFVVC